MCLSVDALLLIMYSPKDKQITTLHSPSPLHCLHTAPQGQLFYIDIAAGTRFLWQNQFFQDHPVKLLRNKGKTLLQLLLQMEQEV